MRVVPLILSLALLGGCSTMPDVQRPKVATLNAWQTVDQGALARADTHWRDLFADPALSEVIALGLENNRDLRRALLNVERFRAQYRIQRAELLPTVSANGSSLRQRLPADVSPSGAAVTSGQHGVNLGLAAYELDLFGRLRSLEAQALQSYLSQEQAQRSVQLTLVASLANAYLEWVADREQLRLAEQTRQIEADNLALVQERYDQGVASELELAQSQAVLEDAEVTLSRYRRLVALDLNALTLLVGAPLPSDWQPGRVLAEVGIADVQPDLPSQLLNRRPDILAAEHRLYAANASIGAARAAFFPSISLTANAGTLSSGLDNLFASGSGAWVFSPRINLPIFTGGRLEAQLGVAETDRDLAVAEYEQAVQNAFTEVANALANRDGYIEQLASQQRATAAYQRYFDIAEQRYRNGIDSMLTRLDAQRNLVASQQSAINTRLALLQAKVDLYRALGGWYQSQS